MHLLIRGWRFDGCCHRRAREMALGAAQRARAGFLMSRRDVLAIAGARNGTRKATSATRSAAALPALDVRANTVRDLAALSYCSLTSHRYVHGARLQGRLKAKQVGTGASPPATRCRCAQSGRSEVEREQECTRACTFR
jgi:hypothetical protein